MMFKEYQSKPTIRKAHLITGEEKNMTMVGDAYPCQHDVEIDGKLISFTASEPVNIGDYIVYLNDNDVYHCNAKVFAERNVIGPEELPAKVTFDHIKGVIAEEQYLQPVGTLTICILTLKNGFRVTGESACADPAIFNKEDGEKYAKDDAMNKVWMLEGYLLKEALYHAGK